MLGKERVNFLHIRHTEKLPFQIGNNVEVSVKPTVRVVEIRSQPEAENYGQRHEEI
jgi:hypothetical protein